MKKTFWVVNKATNKDHHAEIYIYGYIGSSFDGVTAQSFVRELNQLVREGFTNIDVRINSGGGSVFEGFAIFNAMRNCKATIHTYIDGIAASMGTPIACAGSKIYMSRMAQYMTHRVTGGSYGNADEMEKQAKMMRELETSICSIYAERTGKTTDECREKYMTGQDRWLNAEEALAEGLIDGIYDMTDNVEAPENVTDEKLLWEHYNHQLQPILNKFIDNNNPDNMKEVKLPITAALLTLLGLTNAADETAVVNAVNLALNENKQLKADKEQLKNELKEAKESNAADQVTALLDDAQKEGQVKINNATRKRFETSFAGKPDELKAVLAAMPVMGSVLESIKPEDSGDPVYKQVKDLSFDQLMEQDLAAVCKSKFPDLYKEKYIQAKGQAAWDKANPGK